MHRRGYSPIIVARKHVCVSIGSLSWTCSSVSYQGPAVRRNGHHGNVLIMQSFSRRNVRARAVRLLIVVTLTLFRMALVYLIVRRSLGFRSHFGPDETSSPARSLPDQQRVSRMVVLGTVENVREWWDRIAKYWLRRRGKKKGTLLELAKLHARIQCVHLPPQPSWPKDLFSKGSNSTYLQAVLKTAMQNKVSVQQPSPKRVKVSDPRKRSPPLHGDLAPSLKKDRPKWRRRRPPTHDDHMWS